MSLRDQYPYCSKCRLQANETCEHGLCERCQADLECGCAPMAPEELADELEKLTDDELGELVAHSDRITLTDDKSSS